MRNRKRLPRPSGSKARWFVLASSLAILSSPLPAKDLSPALEMARQLNEAFVEVVETVSPAVVVIEVIHKPGYGDLEIDNPLLEMFPELRRHLEDELDKQRRSERPTPGEPRFDDPGSGRGSGIVLRQDGYILTNSHVVEGADKIRVRFKDGRVFAAQVRGTDPQSDVAVIKIEAADLVTAKLGDSAQARVGEFAIAIGAPFNLDYSVTFGHISAKGRTQVISGLGENSLGASMDQDFIQTDASINPGNSGGPLVNISGEVIGINTLIRGLRTGIGFAVPSNLARNVAEQLIAEGKFSRAWIGVSVQPLKTSELRQLVQSAEGGLVVWTIQPDGPAVKSELKRYDIITAVNGVLVSTALDLRNAVRAKKVGSEIGLDVLRIDENNRAKPIKVTVKSAEWPERNFALAARPRRSNEASARSFGMTVQTLTPELAEKYEIEMTEGVVVTDVKPDSPADRERIKAGDLITEVDRKAVATSQQFREAVRAAGSRGVILNLVSNGAPRFRILKDDRD